MTPIQKAQRMFPVGTSVRYFPIVGDPNTHQDGEVRSEPWMLGDQIVVAITGKAGGVSVNHLMVRSDAG